MLAVYLQRRVLIVLLLGFSSGLPLVLTGATLQAWLKVSGIDVKTIGLVTAVAVPYNFKFYGRRWSMPSTCRCWESFWGAAAAGCCWRKSG